MVYYKGVFIVFNKIRFFQEEAAASHPKTPLGCHRVIMFTRYAGGFHLHFYLLIRSEAH